MVWFEDNYQDYEADGHKRLDTDPDQPHRIRYKPPGGCTCTPLRR